LPGPKCWIEDGDEGGEEALISSWSWYAKKRPKKSQMIFGNGLCTAQRICHALCDIVAGAADMQFYVLAHIRSPLTLSTSLLKSASN
jgi:hypothetical protein